MVAVRCHQPVLQRCNGAYERKKLQSALHYDLVCTILWNEHFFPSILLCLLLFFRFISNTDRYGTFSVERACNEAMWPIPAPLFPNAFLL